MIRYTYKDKKYTSMYTLRQAIWDNDHTIFGDLTEELKIRFNITEEEYNPEDEMSDEELAQRVRNKRNSLISQSDFYVQPDYPSTAEGLEAVKAYRQALRDITKQSGFPKEVTWPEPPSVFKKDTDGMGLKLAKVGI